MFGSHCYGLLIFLLIFLCMSINHLKVIIANYKLDSYFKSEGLDFVVDFDRKELLIPLVNSQDDDHY